MKNYNEKQLLDDCLDEHWQKEYGITPEELRAEPLNTISAKIVEISNRNDGTKSKGTDPGDQQHKSNH